MMQVRINFLRLAAFILLLLLAVSFGVFSAGVWIYPDPDIPSGQRFIAGAFTSGVALACFIASLATALGGRK